VVYEAEATALFARFTTPPTVQRKGLINALIKTLKTAGIWSKLDALYLTAAADSQAARRNWLADQYNLTAVSSPSFVADRGYAGDGSASYLSTGFTPSTATSPKFSQNSATLGVWSRTDVAADVCDIGARVSISQDSTAFIRNAGNQFLARLNAASVGGLGPVNLISSGMFAAIRPDAANLIAYVNGSSIGAGAVASVAASSLPLFLAARNEGGTPNSFSSRQYAAAFIGSGLSGPEIANLYSALNTYMAAIGA